MAYETGNGEIASGAADTGGTITDRELMRGLNPESVGQTFIYAEKWQNLNVLLAGSTGLTKKVKSVAEDGYSYESTVHQNETCCGSFVERGEKSCGCNVKEHESKKIAVACEACNCTFNENKKCSANHIGIAGGNACSCGETECASFCCK